MQYTTPNGNRGAFPTAETPQITVCVICRNEADRLGACLKSVAWADEIIVMDLSSEDNSAEVARAHGAQVVRREPHPIVEPLRNEVVELAHGEWILALDPDEQVTPGLARALRVLAGHPSLDAVVVPRMNWDLGYPPSGAVQRYEPQLRMYRRAHVQWPLIPNALPSVPAARKIVLPPWDEVALLHDRNRTIPEVLDRVVRYAPAQAQAMVDSGQRFSARAMLMALLRQIDKEFFWAQTWQDGVPGVLRAGILVAFKFYVWAAFWQLSGAQRTPEDDRLVRRIGRTLAALRWGIATSSNAARRAGTKLARR